MYFFIFYFRLIGGKTLRDVIGRMKLALQNNDIQLFSDAMQQARNALQKLFKLLQTYFKVTTFATYCGEFDKFKFKLKCSFNIKCDDFADWSQNGDTGGQMCHDFLCSRG